MNKTVRLSLYVVGCLVLILGVTASCGLLGTTDDAPVERVLVDSQYVTPQTPAIQTTVPVLDAAGAPTGREYVIVSELDLPDTAPRVPLEKKPGDAIQEPGFWSFLGDLRTGTPVDPFLPFIAYFGAKLAGTKRGRKNAVASAKALSGGQIPSAVANLLAADGWLHTR